ncbi:MAG: hypothetical protein KAX38_05280 [Candidatus Krumholzibacteria bacterium]|nr:hypothetical protein [Candidatus Krumholzibacteria bacterium]
MNWLKINRSLLSWSLTAAIILALSSTISADDLFVTFDLSNGVEVHLYTPETILERMIERDGEGRLVLNLPDGEMYLLVGDVSDPVIKNKGDGAFHPMKVELVVQALDEIDLYGTKMDMIIEVYILPYPRYCILRSTARGNKLFLSPGVYEINRCITAYIVTHEFGHAFQNKYLPDNDEDGWRQYLSLRGIYGNPDYSENSSHRNRPKEIFAEDFRYLFGGEDCRYSGTIENPNMPLPGQVDGLEEFIVSLAACDIASMSGRSVPPATEIQSASNYPNPFNPTTTIHAVFSGSSTSRDHYVDLRIYGVDGSLVRVLHQGIVTDSEFEIAWDGTNGNGAPVASGIYLFRLRSERDVATGKMFLIR